MMKKFLSFREAADYLGIPEAALRKQVDKGRIPAYKIGGIYTRFKVDDLNMYHRRIPKRAYHGYPVATTDRIKDFFYFNDFYIYSTISIIVILYLIFK